MGTPLELLWGCQDLSKLLGFGHHVMAFYHVAKRQHRVNDRLDLALAYPVNHVFKLGFCSLR